MVSLHDHEWYETLYQEMYPPLRRYLLGLLKTNLADAQLEIDDCIHNSFVLLWEKRATLINHPNIRGWLYITSRNKLSDQAKHLRIREMRRAFSLDETLLGDSPNPSRRYTDAQIAIISGIIGEEILAILEKYYDKNTPRKELAQQCGISVDALNMRVLRWIRKIRSILERMEI